MSRWTWLTAAGATIAVVACTSPAVVRQGAGGFEGLDLAGKLARLDSLGPLAATNPGGHRAIAIVLHDSSAVVANKAAYWLARVGSRSIPSLTDGLKDPKPGTQSAAAYGLGELGPVARPTVPSLIEVLAGQDDSAAAMADWAIGKIASHPGRVVVVTRALRWGPRHRWLDRFEEIAQMGSLATPLVPFLIRALGDDDEVVADAAGSTLARLGPVAQAAVLRAALDGGPAIRSRASRLVSALRPGL